MQIRTVRGVLNLAGFGRNYGIFVYRERSSILVGKYLREYYHATVYSRADTLDPAMPDMQNWFGGHSTLFVHILIRAPVYDNT